MHKLGHIINANIISNSSRSSKELAKKMGISSQNLTNIKNTGCLGEDKARERIKAIANYLDIGVIPLVSECYGVAASLAFDKKSVDLNGSFSKNDLKTAQFFMKE